MKFTVYHTFGQNMGYVPPEYAHMDEVPTPHLEYRYPSTWPQRTYYEVDYDNSRPGDYEKGGPALEALYKDANAVGSKSSEAGMHLPVLDIDHPVRVVETSHGRSHVYIDVPVPEDKYFKLLDVLAECGIIEEGYASASKERGMTRVRKPETLDEVKPWQ